MIFEKYLPDERATLDIAAKLGVELQGRCIVFLEGQLGVGKTTFSRGILRAKGHEGTVKSPTFTLVEPYDVPGGQVYHFDLYRLNSPEEVEYLGVDDYLDSDQLCLIEWSDRGRHYLPDCDLLVHLTVEGKGRKLGIEGKSERGRSICQVFKDKNT